MKLRDLTTEQIETLAKKVDRNPEHLKKIARGERPCPAKLAEKIEEKSGGLLKKEDLVWPG